MKPIQVEDVYWKSDKYIKVQPVQETWSDFFASVEFNSEKFREVIKCFKCNQIVGEVTEDGRLVFALKRCFTIVARESVEKLKIRINDEILEHHILVEASKEMMLFLKAHKKPSSEKRNSQSTSSQVFFCAECEAILCTSSEIDYIIIEDRKC